MEAERSGGSRAAPPLTSSSSSSLPLGGDEAAAPALGDSAGPAILPSSPPQLLDLDEDEDLEVFSKVQRGKGSVSPGAARRARLATRPRLSCRGAGGPGLT